MDPLERQIKHLKTSTTLAQTQDQKLYARKYSAEMISKKNAENTWINACISSLPEHFMP